MPPIDKVKDRRFTKHFASSGSVTKCVILHISVEIRNRNGKLSKPNRSIGSSHGLLEYLLVNIIRPILIFQRREVIGN